MQYQEIRAQKMAFPNVGRSIIILIAIICAFSLNSQVAGIPLNRGVLDAKNGTTEGSFCIVFYPNITTLPHNKTDAQFSPLVDLTTWDGCGDFSQKDKIEGNVAIVTNGNCSLNAKVRNVEKYKGRGLLVVMTNIVHVENNTTPTNLPVAFILEESKDILVEMGDRVEVFIFAPTHTSRMDYSLLVIWAIAVVTVAIGAYWSGLVRYDLQQQQHTFLGEGQRGHDQPQGKTQQQEEVSLSVTPTLVAVFVVCMCGMLLLLYFFFNYLVYVIIGLFTLASTTAVYQCLEPLIQRIPFGACKLPRCNFYCFKVHVEVRQLLLAAAAVSLSVCWLVYRKKSFAWILQDILGFAFSVNMLRLIRLPSLKICALLLVLLFFYDIFFVFITPLFTKNGQSVMVEVATGGGSGVGGGGFSTGEEPEQLPMVVKVPLLEWEPLDVCGKPYSLLGYGDILVPGMLVAFCHGFDMATHNRRKIYYVITLLAYGLGLIATFVGLFLMASAQPALLYLVPFTLIPVALVGLGRNELRLLWSGDGHTMESQRLNDSGHIEENGVSDKTAQSSESPADSDSPSDNYGRALI